MDSEEFGESTSTPPVTEQAEGWEKAEGSFLEDEYSSAIKGFVCLSTQGSCEQTNKQNCQIIFFDACKMWWYWKDLKSGKTLCSKSVDTFQNGQLFKNPTLYDAYIWHVSKWAIIQEPPCMLLMWSSLFAELFFPTKWAQRQRPGEFHRIVHL